METGCREMREKVSILLMFQILDLIKESGANGNEAQAALGAATAMITELGLPVKPSIVI
jgi:hypothetical protein